MKKLSLYLIVAIVMCVSIPFLFENKKEILEEKVTITNPYEGVNWTTYGQYKADFHIHSTNSDGGKTTSAMVEEYYKKGFDIISMTDHNYLTRALDNVGKGSVSKDRLAELEKEGFININYAVEHSRVNHLNSFFVDYVNKKGETIEQVLENIEKQGGISFLNHPGRYTRAFIPIARNGDIKGGKKISTDSEIVKGYTDLFKKYKSLVGIEIVTKLDIETAGDRLLWDSILSVMMPEGRNVWGFANADSHNTSAVGYTFNIMLMSSNTENNIRSAIETGSFYAVSRISRIDGINSKLSNGAVTPDKADKTTEYMLEEKTPSIKEIKVNNGSITIIGLDYDVIEWISDGVVVSTGSTINLYEHEVNSYVRAQLKSKTGIAFTQAFGVSYN